MFLFFYQDIWLAHISADSLLLLLTAGGVDQNVFRWVEKVSLEDKECCVIMCTRKSVIWMQLDLSLDPAHS